MCIYLCIWEREAEGERTDFSTSILDTSKKKTNLWANDKQYLQIQYSRRSEEIHPSCLLFPLQPVAFSRREHFPYDLYMIFLVYVNILFNSWRQKNDFFKLSLLLSLSQTFFTKKFNNNFIYCRVLLLKHMQFIMDWKSPDNNKKNHQNATTATTVSYKLWHTHVHIEFLLTVTFTVLLASTGKTFE